MFKELDMQSYARRAHFDYFRSLANPYVGVTCDVDITRFYYDIKASGRPFFLSFLWHVINAANGVPELRQRISGDGIIQFDDCPASCTVALDDGTYCYCTLHCDKPLGAFITYAQEEQRLAKQRGGIEEDPAQALSMYFVSCLPWLSYTALAQPTPYPADSNPRITWGKFREKEGVWTLPVTLLCHHALVDGRHMAEFYRLLEESLNARC